MTTTRDIPRETDSDAQLIAASLDDPARFAAVFERHVQAIFAFVAARVGPQRAEDIVGEVFSVAFGRRDSFDLTFTSARPWLYGIAARTLMHHHRLERRWLELTSLRSVEMSGDDFAAADGRLDARRMAPVLARALAALRPHERDVLLLFVFGELTHEAIATALGIRQGTAKARLSRACARLRRELDGERGFDQPADPEEGGSDD
ncbi:MAG: polymerase, sigma-24 subunit, subfamily [Thermoleophilia bacterium]|nr:polymerase, sigma-24 subunit, subfamily [Thermoleophilia bacterium]